MEERTILQRVSELVDEEHRLRGAVQSGSMTSEEEQSRLRAVEVELDQCWDLLRRRRAGQPDAGVRPPDEVERYLQ